MPLNLYNETYRAVFESEETAQLLDDWVQDILNANNLYFIGNGGSNSITSHMMEDFGKMVRKRSYSFTDPALITCYANDYGYENALAEWLKLYMEPGDLLIAISSSGNSANIINGVKEAQSKGVKVLSCSGFSADNKLRALSDSDFHISAKSYGIVECFHQVFIHAVLDACAEKLKA
ncbi:SIS domain-containing protein [bacterium SCSIO 12741]|nr:SIS domain-containing protein [bacterium SCSIO 12741]